MAFLLKLVVGDQDLPYSKIEKEKEYKFDHGSQWSVCPGISKSSEKVRVPFSKRRFFFLATTTTTRFLIPHTLISQRNTNFRPQEPVTIFSMKGKSETGSNFLRRMKTIKHPSILQFKAGLERDDTTVVATEYAIPLRVWIQQNHTESQVVLGFSQILDALQFLNEDCGLVHGNVTPNAIFVNSAGDFKLGGLELCSDYNCPGAVPNLWMTNPRFVPEKYQDPERRSGRWKGGSTRFSSDVYSFAMTMREVLGSRVPPSIEPCITKMLSDSTRRRPSPKRVLKLAKIFKSDPFVSTMRELKNWTLMERERRTEFFKTITPLVENFPKSACIHKLLPILLESIRFAENDTDASGASVALAPLLTVGSMIEDPKEFQKNILPPVVRLFASNNRAVRLQLLRHADAVVPKLPQSTMNTKIFDNMRGGFADSVPALREWTIRAMVRGVFFERIFESMTHSTNTYTLEHTGTRCAFVERREQGETVGELS